MKGENAHGFHSREIDFKRLRLIACAVGEGVC